MPTHPDIDLSAEYTRKIQSALDNCLETSDLPWGRKHSGKVRDRYEQDDKLILITTDRQSAFDRVLAAIPFKGQVLNQTSAWWFEKTRHIVDNHVLSVPDPNVTIAKKCEVLPIEFVVRGYITGSTSTSLWTVYKNGQRSYCGNDLPEGLLKNQQLKQPLLTPTTKETEHDRPIAPAEIVSEGWMTEEDWSAASDIALRLFAFGQETARNHGMILVDTKYEFGKDAEGNITLIDEIHTPDSSRYWIAESYRERFDTGEEPDNIDKEFLRLWFNDHCDPYHDPELPPAPDELVVELSRRYIYLYETITGESLQFPDVEKSINDRIVERLDGYF